MERHRSCTDPPPQYGGLDCTVDQHGRAAVQNQSCNEHNCSGLVKVTSRQCGYLCVVSLLSDVANCY